MLNRRILRIKAFKELFAIEMLPEKSLSAARKELDASLESTRDLYLFMLSSVCAITSAAREKFNQLQLKINKTEEEKHPNLKFIENSLAPLLEEDVDFQKLLKKKGLSWGAYDLIIKKIYASMQTRDYFAEYMADPERSLCADCRLFIHVFEEEFVDREDLETALEDLSIYWNDDLAYALTWCCRSVESLAKGSAWSLPPLYLSDMRKGMEDDDVFVHKLLNESYANYDKFSSIISESVANWDRDRLVGTDIALIVTALSEIVSFSDIPVNVSINEYVEIAKYYGTPKSSTFVNGILDTLSKKVEFQKK